jgi:hypothetical protein
MKHTVLHEVYKYEVFCSMILLIYLRYCHLPIDYGT